MYFNAGWENGLIRLAHVQKKGGSIPPPAIVGMPPTVRRGELIISASQHSNLKMKKEIQYNKVCSRCGRRFETCYRHSKICENCSKSIWKKKKRKI